MTPRIGSAGAIGTAASGEGECGAFIRLKWRVPQSHSTVAFKLAELFPPAGDQPEAIDKLVEGIDDGLAFQTLLGVTGSGKTYTMANVIARLGRPALVLAPNKTLAAQLYSEFREFFPENAVEYFVSYYDYYQPEAYVPARDLYIEKDSSINEHIEQMRLSATKSLLERRDVVIVATVSAIYGIGDPSRVPRHDPAPAPGREDGAARRAGAAWWRCSTSATSSTSAAARSACAAT